jgi:hypothetical protein
LKYHALSYTFRDKSQWRFEHVLRKMRPEEEDGSGRNEEEGSSKEEEVSLAPRIEGGLSGMPEDAAIIPSISSLFSLFMP